MSDKSWMLNVQAITAAKKCISIVEAELGIRLKLSNPDFLELLVEYVELNNSLELEKALLVLAQYAPAKVQSEMIVGGATASAKIINLEDKKAQVNQTGASLALTGEDSGEAMVVYRGKEYRRYQDGMEFKGLYRGQPRYG